jgi:hypothetical protein
MDGIEEARDPLAPADPSTTVDSTIDPTQTIPNPGAPSSDTSDLDGGEFQYWLRDGVTPYRTRDNADAHVFSTQPGDQNGWHINHMVDRSKLWPSSAGEIAGMIGGRQRLTEPTVGVAPLDPGPDEDFAPVESPDLIEADATGDMPPPPTGNAGPPLDDLPDGGMNEQQIRDAGLRIDVPYEAPMPVALKYKDTGQKAWTPPPGWRQGASPIDEKLAADLGVPRDLGQAQEGTESGGSSGDSGEPGA